MMMTMIFNSKIVKESLLEGIRVATPDDTYLERKTGLSSEMLNQLNNVEINNDLIPDDYKEYIINGVNNLKNIKSNNINRIKSIIKNVKELYNENDVKDILNFLEKENTKIVYNLRSFYYLRTFINSGEFMKIMNFLKKYNINNLKINFLFDKNKNEEYFIKDNIQLYTNNTAPDEVIDIINNEYIININSKRDYNSYVYAFTTKDNHTHVIIEYVKYVKEKILK